MGRDLIKLSFKAVQLVTGHGNMGAYIARFRLRDTDGACTCGLGREDPVHIMEVCQRVERADARAHIGNTYGDLGVTLRNNKVASEGQVRKLETWANRVITEELYREQQEEDSESDEF